MREHPSKEVALMAWMDAQLQGWPAALRDPIWAVLVHGVQKHGADRLAHPLEHLEHGVAHARLLARDPHGVEPESGMYEWAHVAARNLLALYAIQEMQHE